MAASPGDPAAVGSGGIRRILREYKEITLLNDVGTARWRAVPFPADDMYEWHFTVRGPENTEFEEGFYHGKLILPPNYPLAPPAFFILTPNGRFEVNQKICLSSSDFHPELWQPAWGIRTLLEALPPFFATPAEGAVHALDWSAEVRRSLARRSPDWVCPGCGVRNADAFRPRRHSGAQLAAGTASSEGGNASNLLKDHSAKRSGAALVAQDGASGESTAATGEKHCTTASDTAKLAEPRLTDDSEVNSPVLPQVSSRQATFLLFRAFVVKPFCHLLHFGAGTPPATRVDAFIVALDRALVVLCTVLLLLTVSLWLRPPEWA